MEICDGNSTIFHPKFSATFFFLYSNEIIPAFCRSSFDWRFHPTAAEIELLCQASWIVIKMRVEVQTKSRSHVH